MKKYIQEYLKFNLRKCTIMLLMLIMCSTLVLFTLDVINNLTFEMQSSMKGDVAKEDIETLIFMLMCGVGLIIGFGYCIVANTYSVLLFGRETEFNLLNNLGFYKARIRNMLFAEGSILAIVAFVVGSLLSKVLSLLLMGRFGLEEVLQLPISAYMCVGIGIWIVVLFVINKNLKILSIGTNDVKKNRVMVLQSNQVKRKTIMSLVGTVLMVACMLDAEAAMFGAFGKEAEFVQIVVFVGAILIALDGWIYWLLRLLRQVALRFKINSLYLAVEQDLYDFKKIKSIINSLILSVALLVGFQGLFESIRGTTEDYINESINYDWMVICDDLATTSQETIRQELDQRATGDKLYSIALTLKMSDPNEKVFILTGIDEAYYAMQRFYVVENGDINEIYSEGGPLKVLFSSKKAGEEQWKVGDTITEYAYNNEVLEFEISTLYDPIHLKQGFTSREALSKKLYGEQDKYNTIYFTGFAKEEVDEILNKYRFKDYEAYDMGTFRKECVDQAINGTEMIEVILYMSMIFAASLVVNIFVLSFNDRIRQYTELRILGANKKLIVRSMLIESAVIYIIGAIIGFMLAIPGIEGALAFMQDQLIFETALHIPYGRLLLILVGCFVGILGFTMVIGKYSLKNNMFKFNYKE